MLEIIQKLADSADSFVTVIAALGGALLSLLAIKFATKREVSNVIQKAADNDEKIVIQLSETDKELQARVRKLEDGYIKISERLKEFPTKEALSQTCLELEETQGDLKALKAQMAGLSDLLKRCENTVGMLVENEVRK